MCRAELRPLGIANPLGIRQEQGGAPVFVCVRNAVKHLHGQSYACLVANCRFEERANERFSSSASRAAQVRLRVEQGMLRDDSPSLDCECLGLSFVIREEQ